MNSWPELYKEYEKEPEMIAFREWCFKNGFEDGGSPISFTRVDIKTIFGFAVKYIAIIGWTVRLKPTFSEKIIIGGLVGKRSLLAYYNDLFPLETAMFWVVNKYFEIITKRGE